MLKINYKNPMEKTYQYEYALYMLVSDLFQTVVCNSMCIDSLKLYYMDLVKENRNTGNPSYEKQYVVEEEIQTLIEKDVIGKIKFPGMHVCRAEVTVRTKEDGAHVFTFSDGIYGFSVSLNMKENDRPEEIEVVNLLTQESECKLGSERPERKAAA